MFKKLYLLTWKNLLYLKRHYIVTACEIILPALFAIVLAYLKSKTISNDYYYDYDGEGGSPNDRETGFMEYNETAMVVEIADMFSYSSYSNRTNLIGYSPRSNIGERIMTKLVGHMTRIYEPSLNHTRMPDRLNITGFRSEEDMAEFNSLNFLTRYYNRDPNEDSNSTVGQQYDIIFGLVFEGLSDNQVGSKVSYKIRMNSWFDTRRLISDDGIFPGPDRYGARMYISTGFSGIQYLVDKVLIEELTGSAEEPSYSFTMQAFPYPTYKDMDLQDLMYIFLPVFLVIGFVFIVPQVVRAVVSEKETGIKELMKMSGLPEWMHWVGWLLNSLMLLTVTVIIIVIVLCVPFSSEAGAVFEHSDPTLLWVVLMIYMLWSITFCFMVSSFFEKPTLATTFGIVIWLVSFFGLGLSMQESYGKDFSVGLKLLFCLFPNVAIHLAIKSICDFEMSEAGAKWGNINDTVPGSNGVNLLYVIFMFFASICLNMIICLYMEAVLPKKYGVRKPLYYIFMPSEWGFGKRATDAVLSNDGASSMNNKPGFEDDPQGIKAGVQINKLRKEFGKEKVAVNDVSMNIFEGQIFCLLGQNGAGKTTTMSILTGLLPPTTGTAFIDGYDIRTNMGKIRENLGLCPQHNMLFDKMTVLEHFKFFGMLKGLSMKKAAEEGVELLRVLQIEEKKNVLSMSLSGGQKRRLSLGMSLIGGSKVIFLDEPTSGMDPEARRAIWDILLKIRGERTIVLTTHFMEEADVLGDRIGILANGVLQCCGTPNYLKRFYGAGYTLNMTVKGGADPKQILSTVCKHITDAHFKETHSNNANELSIVLPSDSTTSAKFPNLFSELNNEQGRLRIDEIGVGWTTMDEVFVRVEELSHTGEEQNNNVQSFNQNGTNELKPIREKLSGMKLAVNQFYGLLLKKLFYIIRKKRLVLSQMAVPVLLTIAAIAIGRVLLDRDDEQFPALKLTLSSYKKPVTLYSSVNEQIGTNYAGVVGSSASRLAANFGNNVSLGLLAAGYEDIARYRDRHIVAAEISPTNMKAMYSSLAYHSAPLSLNLLTNTYLQSEFPGKGYQVEVTNYPFADDIADLFRQSFESDIDMVFAIVFAVLLPVGLSLLVGSFLIGPTEERITKGKQLQLMTGVNPFLYWSSSFICDLLLTLVAICLMVACLPIFERNKMFTNHDGAGILFLVMLIYAIASIPFSYVFSTFVRGVPGGFTLITIVNILAGVGLGIASYIVAEQLESNPNAGIGLFLEIVGRLFPTFGFTKASIDYATTSTHNSQCYTIPKSTLRVACDPNLNTSRLQIPVSRTCCENCAVFGECFEPWPYFRWVKGVEKFYAAGPKIHYVPALAQDLVWLSFMAIVYFAILMLVEYDVFQRLVERIFKRKQSLFSASVDDDDVLGENERVSQLVKTASTSEDAMVVDNLCKSFGSFSAVSKLSFGVHHGECFGLLGVNGAGKTTTFRMLTGDETRSNGNAFMNNLSLALGRKEFLSMLGYCPQFDGIIGVLSGKEMLLLFARLRGVPGHRVEEEADKWLQKAGLTASANVQCKNYSGGMKRRLSAAISLIGDSPVILLDEPTSGVDPVARRQFWKIISSIKNSGQAIILTSHSMEECEALCSRLGIMVNGEMQCLGGVQHLKNKFAQGFSLTIKLKQEGIQENSNVVQAITGSVLQNFEPSSLKDHHQTTMKFQIHSRSHTWEYLYSKMEQIKSNFQGVIEEYAITETTLEEVFLSFARKQYVSERVTQGGGGGPGMFDKLCGNFGSFLWS